jgi:hypothetical protein
MFHDPRVLFYCVMMGFFIVILWQIHREKKKLGVNGKFWWKK